jgi:hypothetical protein
MNLKKIISCHSDCFRYVLNCQNSISVLVGEWHKVVDQSILIAARRRFNSSLLPIAFCAQGDPGEAGTSCVLNLARNTVSVLMNLAKNTVSVLIRWITKWQRFGDHKTRWGTG